VALPIPKIAIFQNLDFVKGAVPFTDQTRSAARQGSHTSPAIRLCCGPEGAQSPSGMPTKGFDLDLVGDGFCHQGPRGSRRCVLAKG
jgi:hypothetical protein